MQNVDRRPSETKELMRKKITQHVRYKTCTFLSCPIQGKKNVKLPTFTSFLWGNLRSNVITFYFELKGRCRTVRNCKRVELLAGLRCSEGLSRSPFEKRQWGFSLLGKCFSTCSLPSPPPPSPNISSGFSLSLLLALFYPQPENKCTRRVLKTLNKTNGHWLS